MEATNVSVHQIALVIHIKVVYAVIQDLLFVQIILVEKMQLAALLITMNQNVIAQLLIQMAIHTLNVRIFL